MTIQCPHCASRTISSIPTFTFLLASIGAASGIATATTFFTAKSTGGVLTVIKTPAYLAACISACTQGAAAGKKLGAELDQKHFPRFRCKNCLRTFPSIFSFNF